MNSYAELPRQIVAERGSTNFRDRQPTGSHHQNGSSEFRIGRPQHEILVPLHLADAGSQKDADVSQPALFQQHGQNVVGRAIAEELTHGFFVIRDAISFDQLDKIRGRVARERRLREMRIRGKKVIRTAVKVREIASPAAGNQDLLAHPIRALEHRHAPPAFACCDGAHQSRCPATHNQRVEGVGHERSHVEQAEPRQSIFLQQPLVGVLLMQLFDLRPGHLRPIRCQIAVRLRTDGKHLFIGGPSQQRCE